MKVEDIWERIRIRSGQFILSKSKLELDVENFKVLVEDALAEYNRSRPFDKTYVINIAEPRHFTFSEDFDPAVKRVPEMLAEVTPVRPISANPWLYGNVLSNPVSGSSELVDPLQVPWDYSKPVLTVSLSSQYKVVALYNHEVIQTVPEEGTPYWECTTISVNEDPWFFKLLQGMFLQGIGRSRRAFTLSDMPITMDADQLYSEGQQIEEQALEQIHMNKKIYLAMR